MTNKELTNKVEEKMPLSDIFYYITDDGKVEVLQTQGLGKLSNHYTKEVCEEIINQKIHHITEDGKVEPYQTQKLDYSSFPLYI